MNASPVETFEGAAVVVSSIIHEIRVGAKVARRRDPRN
jgi:hypothetical protein